MANTIQLKRSSVAGRIPNAANVEVGEPVVNLNDRVLYTKTGSGEIIKIASGNISGLSDVSNATPSVGQTLVWNGTVWSPDVISGLGTPFTYSYDFGSITDVSSTDAFGVSTHFSYDLNQASTDFKRFDLNILETYSFT